MSRQTDTFFKERDNIKFYIECWIYKTAWGDLEFAEGILQSLLSFSSAPWMAWFLRESGDNVVTSSISWIRLFTMVSCLYLSSYTSYRSFTLQWSKMWKPLLFWFHPVISQDVRWVGGLLMWSRTCTGRLWQDVTYLWMFSLQSDLKRVLTATWVCSHVYLELSTCDQITQDWC